MKTDFKRAFDIYLETLPFVLIRLAVYGFAVLLTVGWFYLVFLLFMTWPFPGPAWLAWVLGGVLYSRVAVLVRNYLLYLVKAAHVGAITQLVLHRQFPRGDTLLDFAWRVVRENFWRITVLFAVDRLVNAVLKAFNHQVVRLVPLAGGKEGGFFKTFLDYTVGYVDEAVFSYTLVKGDENPWRSAREGLVLYAQNWKTILGSGLILAAASYLVVGVAALPAAFLLYGVPMPFRHMWWAIALGVGFMIKFILYDPFALTAVIVNYHTAVAGQESDPAWEKRLAEVSGKFAEIRKLEEGWNPAG